MALTGLLSIAQIVPATRAEGPGKRFAIWFQGCPLRCPGCCNPEMLSFDGGVEVSCQSLLGDVLRAQVEHDLEGVTLLGGEPFAHASGAAELAEGVRDAGLSVMIFTGFTLGELRARSDEGAQRLLAATDILVDGPYLRDQPEPRRRWIGSANQQVHFLSPRYQADDPRWLEPNSLEIRFRGGEVSVNGYPAASAANFWRRLPQQANER